MSRLVVSIAACAALLGCSDGAARLGTTAQELQRESPENDRLTAQSATLPARAPVPLIAADERVEESTLNRPRRGIAAPNPASGIMSPGTLPGEIPREYP